MRRSTLVSNLFTAVALCVALAACSDNKGGPAGLPGSGSDVVGTWVLDWNATMPGVQKMIDDQMKQIPEEQRKAAEPMMKEMFKKMTETKVQLRIESGGTFSGDFPGEPGTTEGIKGTWKKEGEGIALTGTEKNGAAIQPGSEDAKTVHGKIVGGELHVTSPEKEGMILIFKKA